MKPGPVEWATTRTTAAPSKSIAITTGPASTRCTVLDECRSDAPAPEATAETALLLEEVKIGCTLGMLTCLDRPHRLAYILGEILEMDGDEAARVLAIRPAAFR